MAHELHLIKHQSGILIPATPEISDLLQSKFKLGAVLVAEFRQARNPAFHRRFFALLNLGFEYWEPTGGAISSNERKLVHSWTLLSNISTASPINAPVVLASANPMTHTVHG